MYQSVATSIDKAYEENSAIIFSCEICGSNEMDDYISKNLMPDKTLCIAVPSYHQKIDDKNSNQSMIFYYNDSLEFKNKNVQKAEHFFEYLNGEKINIEDLENEKPKYIIFHLKNIGVVLFVICKDALTTTFSKFIDVLNPNITIVISYTPKYGEFNTALTKLTSTGNLLIIGNSCHALEGSDAIKPLVIYQNGKADPMMKVTYKFGNCGDRDSCRAMEYCYYNIDISLEDEKGYRVINIKNEQKLKE